jgi:hypothetical protein
MVYLLVLLLWFGMPQGQLATCPYCQQVTLADGYYCVACGRMLRQLPPHETGGQIYKPEAPQTYKPYGEPPPGGQPFIVCSFCHTLNQPWLDNCKSCQRPLMKTAKE